MKQRHLLSMMMHVEKCVREQKEIQVINAPDEWTPHDLSKYYIEQYDILEEAKKQPDYILKEWLTQARLRSPSEITKKEIEILEALT